MRERVEYRISNHRIWNFEVITFNYNCLVEIFNIFTTLSGDGAFRKCLVDIFSERAWSLGRQVMRSQVGIVYSDGDLYGLISISEIIEDILRITMLLIVLFILWIQMGWHPTDRGRGKRNCESIC